jgi:hypothetical protein
MKVGRRREARQKGETCVHERPLARCRECSFVNSRWGKPSDTDEIMRQTGVELLVDTVSEVPVPSGGCEEIVLLILLGFSF